MIKTNYHTHTRFCDGAESAEAMACAAFDKGFNLLGFSAHALYPFSLLGYLPVSAYNAYFSEIERLKGLYADRMEILAGFEVDWFPPISLADASLYRGLGAQYIIGSVHMLSAEALGTPPEILADGRQRWLSVDGSASDLARGIEELALGEGKRLVQAYFSSVRDMLAASHCDIIGHIDLVRRRNPVLRFFDEGEPWYMRELKETVQAVVRSGAVVEINTGGMARGSLDTPYPSFEFLRMLSDRDVPFQINSDAHQAAHIDFAFDEALNYARSAGVKRLVYLSHGTWQEYKI